MMDHNKDNLARQQAQDEVSFSEITDFPDVDFSPRLEQYLARIGERIKQDGISSLYWVTGINTGEVSKGLLEAMKDVDKSEADCCIVVTPNESQLVEPFRSQYDVPVLRMKELYTTDSFLVVNEAAVLDVTPVDADDGEPEYNDDPTVVNLYIGLFNMFKSQSEA